MTKRHVESDLDAQKGSKHLVFFTVEKVLPLIGGGAAVFTEKNDIRIPGDSGTKFSLFHFAVAGVEMRF